MIVHCEEERRGKLWLRWNMVSGFAGRLWGEFGDGYHDDDDGDGDVVVVDGSWW